MFCIPRKIFFDRQMKEDEMEVAYGAQAADRNVGRPYKRGVFHYLHVRS